MQCAAGDAPELVVGPRALDEVEALWRVLEADAELPVFQRLGWARAWLEHLGGGGVPWLVVGRGSRPLLWPLFLRRRAGVRVLGLLGDGVSDYLGPLGRAAGETVGPLVACLERARARFDLLDLRSLALPDDARAALRLGLGRGAFERVYERCPVIDTSGGWEGYLQGRRKKFRANLKRAARRVAAHGPMAVARERAGEALLAELEAVERESWKWGHGTAYLRAAGRKAFLRRVLLDPELPSEIWTCRLAAELVGFAVVFTTSRSRHYYLPSFRDRFSDVGTYLLGEIVRESFASGCAEVDLLQGDEGYKTAWATGERAVHELVSPGGGPLGSVAALALRARWRLARSPSARRLHDRVVSWRGRRLEGEG
jgi:CelD/BcsL family acetyltransferase involved in cellulose biosynthesis